MIAWILLLRGARVAHQASALLAAIMILLPVAGIVLNSPQSIIQAAVNAAFVIVPASLIAAAILQRRRLSALLSGAMAAVMLYYWTMCSPEYIPSLMECKLKATVLAVSGAIFNLAVFPKDYLPIFITAVIGAHWIVGDLLLIAQSLIICKEMDLGVVKSILAAVLFVLGSREQIRFNKKRNK
jgi:hypothetical protein